MQVKVFEAKDMATGLRMIRQELGPEALILSTRTVKNGKLGLLGKQYMEITAAIDNQFRADNVLSNHGAPQPKHHYGHTVYKESNLGNRNDEETEVLHPEIAKDNDKDVYSAIDDDDSEKSGQSNSPQFRAEIDELKSLVKSLAGEITRINSDKTPSLPVQDNFSSLEKKLLRSKNNTEVEDRLIRHGVNQETSRIISTFAAEQLDPASLSDEAQLATFLHKTIADLVQIQPPVFTDASEQQRIALVGPTGVGKTTTLAKIAAKYISTVSDSVALITIDTYRIAAVEQLKVYGEIMHLPVEVVLTPDQLIQSLEKHRDKELILIDTAGRSQLDRLSIDELQHFFPSELHIDCHLVLSATTRDNELRNTIDCFSGLNIDKTIYTKIDECTQLGVILNTQIKNSCPISYLTNGQRVPEDILEMDSISLAQAIVPFTQELQYHE